jgi:hypothetical protein
MKRLLSIAVLLCCPISAALVASEVFAASNKQAPPGGSFAGAPPEFTRFSPAELQRGFQALAFGSDMRIGAKPRLVRRFDSPIVARIVQSGSVDRSAAMTHIVEEYARKVPNLRLSVAAAGAPEAGVEIRLIDEKNFRSGMRAAFGDAVTKEFVARTDPQCMTNVESIAEGEIQRSISFIIVDKGDRIFLDCAYHELLHAFGLSNHDQRNPWTTLNQHRLVGYLTVYDRALLTALYDPRIKPGMTAAQAKSVLPAVFGDLGFGPEKR